MISLLLRNNLRIRSGNKHGWGGSWVEKNVHRLENYSGIPLDINVQLPSPFSVELQLGFLRTLRNHGSTVEPNPKKQKRLIIPQTTNVDIAIINHPPVFTIDSWYEPLPNGCFIIAIPTLVTRIHLSQWLASSTTTRCRWPIAWSGSRSDRNTNWCHLATMKLWGRIHIHWHSVIVSSCD